MVEQPPKINDDTALNGACLLFRPDVIPLVNEANDKYWYWTDVKYKKLPPDVTAEELWVAIKLSRRAMNVFEWHPYGINVAITNNMQRFCHEFDINFGGKRVDDSLISNEDKEWFLVSSLMEEAISSSQMEGASTTRVEAKDMLRKQIAPRNHSEQMIVNNYASIQFITEHKDDELTSELLLKIHSLMTKKTLEKPEDEGCFRTNDDVVVENGITHEVVHTPPSYKEIPAFVTKLCKFANEEDKNTFIHPIIKAIIIHFMIAYVHPFVDGNGRTARALFYWYMLKKGYWLTEYLSISRIIYRSKKNYEKAYLYAEADQGDIGYFITYHLRVLELAFRELKSYIDRKISQRQNNSDILLVGGINERQATIISWFRDNPNTVLTVKELVTRFAISNPTARLDIDGLVNMGLLTRIPVNKVKSNYIKSPDFDNILSAKTKQ